MSDSTNYAGFWIRFGAWIVDAIVLAVPIIAVSILFPATVDETTGMSSGPNLVGSLIGAAIVGAYFIFMESSAKQASLGKMALGLKVTTMDGGRLSLGKAAVRAWPELPMPLLEQA